MRKAIIQILCVAFCVFAMYCLIDHDIVYYQKGNTVRFVIGALATVGWIGVSYKIIALKYNWLKKLAGL